MGPRDCLVHQALDLEERSRIERALDRQVSQVAVELLSPCLSLLVDLPVDHLIHVVTDAQRSTSRESTVDRSWMFMRKHYSCVVKGYFGKTIVDDTED